MLILWLIKGHIIIFHKKTFVHSKKSHKVKRAIQMQSMWLKMTSARIFYFCKKKNGFARIQRIHSTEKLFKCVWCDKSFHKKKLLSHIRKHILGRSHLNVINVIKVFSENIVYWFIKEPTMEKSQKNVTNVIKCLR